MIKTFLIAGTVTAAAAPLVRRIMIGAGRMDIPNNRSSHVTPVPRGGGLAAFAGVAAAAISDRPRINPGAPLAVATLAGVGYADDHTTASGGLSPKLRLIAQCLAGIVASGDSGAVVRVASSLVTLSVVNVVNFMDGINGITGLTAIVWGLNACLSGDLDVAWIGAATAGAGIGFLPWNAPHALLFLGDTGSYFIGGLFAAGIVRTFVNTRSVASMMTISAPLLPYIADAAQALIRRAYGDRALFEAHREHVYQRVVDRTGAPHVAMALCHAAFASGCAVAWRCLPVSKALPVSTGVVMTYLALPRFLGEGEAV